MFVLISGCYIYYNEKADFAHCQSIGVLLSLVSSNNCHATAYQLKVTTIKANFISTKQHKLHEFNEFQTYCEWPCPKFLA